MSYKILSAYGTMYYVSDMKKTVEYYKNSLGLATVFESDEWTEFGVNGHSLCLHSLSHTYSKPSNGVLIIRVQNINELYQVLKKKGVEFFGEPKELHPGAYGVEFKDPSGNTVSFYEDTNKSA